ncbi:division/cell wall cluster transcriptional repressor MraZ [Ancylobacter mangrovi]|uniref:division/cell wall cluster transcriptional repressor MraZ n=1 Tax=Ancylobacter mangrovi TaxID=2972472 RepID=UPI00216378E6|nr:division/cell wall cluster transcriptional repressor MraZ [Ancylobacter mangrovi]MCS0503803.1 division/cell wall cluster transcriptional repressor MraZ [Ancylobacter mangrovi]
MDRFVSTYAMRLDSKGRMSVPAAFRALIARDGLEHLYCHPALDLPALEAGGARLMAGIDSLVERFPPYSEAREELAGALYGAIETLKLDPEGRVVLSETLKAHAHVKDEAMLVGLGDRFRIWEPERFRAHLAEATAKVRTLKRQLGSRNAGETRGEEA